MLDASSLPGARCGVDWNTSVLWVTSPLEREHLIVLQPGSQAAPSQEWQELFAFLQLPPVSESIVSTSLYQAKAGHRTMRHTNARGHGSFVTTLLTFHKLFPSVPGIINDFILKPWV